MSKPFQFSMRRMLVAVLLFSVAIWLFVHFLATGFNSGVLPPFLYFGSFIVGGAAFGCVEGRPLAWAMFGLFCGLILSLFFLPSSVSPARE